jgi:hypothetical protein
MKTVTDQNPRHGKASGSEAQGSAVTLIAAATRLAPSAADERPELTRLRVERLPAQFEESLSGIARRIWS